MRGCCTTTASCGEAEPIDAEERGGFAEAADAELGPRGARRPHCQPKRASLAWMERKPTPVRASRPGKQFSASSAVLRALRVNQLPLS